MHAKTSTSLLRFCVYALEDFVIQNNSGCFAPCAKTPGMEYVYTCRQLHCNLSKATSYLFLSKYTKKYIKRQ